MANPIKTVTLIGKTGTYTNIPVPSAYTWNLEDVSGKGAGRTEDGTMVKNMLGQAVSLNLEWQNLKTSDVKTVLTAFSSSEYFSVEYLDPLYGGADGYRTVTFYVGNRSVPLYNATLDIWSNVKFNIISKEIRDIK